MVCVITHCDYNSDDELTFDEYSEVLKKSEIEFENTFFEKFNSKTKATIAISLRKNRNGGRNSIH